MAKNIEKIDNRVGSHTAVSVATTSDTPATDINVKTKAQASHRMVGRNSVVVPVVLLVLFVAIQQIHRSDLQLVNYYDVTDDVSDKKVPSAVNNDNTAARTTQPSRTNAMTVTIIVQLSGELGNHLSKLAAALGVAMSLQSRYQIRSNLVLRHQDRTNKWQHAVQDLQQCFPATRRLNVSEAQDFTGVTHRSAHLMPEIFRGINSDDAETVDAALQAVAMAAYNNISSNNNDTHSITLYSNHLSLWDVYVHRYYQQLRQFFAFDENNHNCCHLRPHPHETVLHYRNFAADLPRKHLLKGYQEVSPTDLVEQLLLVPTSTTAVAIVSRRHDERVHALVQALMLQPNNNNTIQVRVIANQSSVQDFCFLKSSQHQMIGNARSTFFGWAALLSSSNTSVVSAYSIDSPTQRQWAQQTGIPLHQGFHNHSSNNGSNSNNNIWLGRIHFPLIVASEEQEEAAVANHHHHGTSIIANTNSTATNITTDGPP